MDLELQELDAAIQDMEKLLSDARTRIVKEMESLSSVTPSDSEGALKSDFSFLQEKKLDSTWLEDLPPHAKKAWALLSLKQQEQPKSSDKQTQESLSVLKYNSKKFDEIRSWKTKLEKERHTPEEGRRIAEEQRREETAKLEQKIQKYQSHFTYVVAEVVGAPPPGFLKFNTLLKELLTPYFSKGENPWLEVKPNWYQGYLAVLESAGVLKRHDSGHIMLLDLTDGHAAH